VKASFPLVPTSPTVWVLWTVALLAAGLAAVYWLFAALRSYPLIVPPDGLAGAGLAMEQARDCEMLFWFSFVSVIAVLLAIALPWAAHLLVLVLVGWMSWFPFESPTTFTAARWPLLAILGLTAVIAYAGSKDRRGAPIGSIRLLLLALLAAGSLVVADWLGRVYFSTSP